MSTTVKSSEHEDAVPIAPVTGSIGGVIHAEAPSSSLVAAQLSKLDVGVWWPAIATCHTRSEADANDLVADALVRVLDPKDRPSNTSSLRSAFYLPRGRLREVQSV